MAMAQGDAAMMILAEEQQQLEQLKAAATKAYSLKDYSEAAERYADACEVQDDMNGEMADANADLLYQYGRCLFHLAVANSDVLGGKVAGSSEEPQRKKRKVSGREEEQTSSSLIGGAIKSGGEQKLVESNREATTSNPFFQISGDDNFTDSEDDGDCTKSECDDGSVEGDDFGTAFEILDMARILLERKLNALSDSKDELSEIRNIKERLADTRDLQAEIALENERFADAITDTRDSLALKMQLYPEENSLIAEAHFKLSLALEFASVTATQEDANGENKVAQIDEAVRADAAKEMELAIASTRARMAKEEARITASTAFKEGMAKEADRLSEDQIADIKKNIAEVTEMIGEMETRLEDLRKPATSLSAMQNLGPAGAPGAEEAAMRGILGSLLGESKSEQDKRIQEATAKANDLSGMVKKKKKPKTVAEPQQESSPAVEAKGGKRKAEEEGAEPSPSNGTGKKVKFAEDDAPE